MSTSLQIIEMLQDLREEELARVSRHRIEAMKMHTRDGVRSAVASALVRVGVALDSDAGARAVQPAQRARIERAEWDADGAAHW